ncbi:MAG: fasciclin domain-containing protein [Pirellulaceae bacterium]|jgi:uncharacterized surface protein with fasciclin (FAS1) repeats|nr:fasciclin domain-containing protein [Pirellulaceae bacterium]
MRIHSRLLIGLVALVAGTATLGTPQTVSARGRGPDIVDVVLAINAKTGEFSTLIAALQTAGLVDALRGGPFTVFAPTDAAFAKLGLNAGNIATALPKEDLTNILLYHVTSGRVGVQAWLKCQQLEMLNEDTTQLSRQRAKLFINSSRVTFGLPVSNGSIYVIDAVLLP